jgi:hypothetical protein
VRALSVEERDGLKYGVVEIVPLDEDLGLEVEKTPELEALLVRGEIVGSPVIEGEDTRSIITDAVPRQLDLLASACMEGK